MSGIPVINDTVYLRQRNRDRADERAGEGRAERSGGKKRKANTPRKTRTGRKRRVQRGDDEKTTVATDVADTPDRSE